MFGFPSRQCNPHGLRWDLSIMEAKKFHRRNFMKRHTLAGCILCSLLDRKRQDLVVTLGDGTYGGLLL
jgi:hypothetical protein